MNWDKQEVLQLANEALRVGVTAFKYGDKLSEELVFNIALAKIKNIKIEEDETVDGSLAYVAIVGRDLELYINPFKVLKYHKYAITGKTPEKQREQILALFRGILKHELLHFILCHLIIDPKRPNNELSNIVQDALINSYIPEFKALKLGFITPEAMLGFRSNYADHFVTPFDDAAPVDDEANLILLSRYAFSMDLTWEKYYDLLKDTEDDSASDSGNEGEEGDNEEKESQSSSSNNANIDKDKAPLLGDIKPISEDQVNPEVIYEIESMLQEIAQKARGTKLGNLVEKVLIDRSKKGEVDWKKLLRQVFSQGSKIVKKHTFKRYDKRYDVPPGTKQKQHGGAVTILVDTSASISSKDLKNFFSEIYYLSKRYRYKVQGWTYDVDLRDSFTSREIHKGSIEITGRGGTNLKQALATLKEKKTFSQSNTIIVLTDGYDDEPNKQDFPADNIIFIFSKDHNKSFRAYVEKYARTAVLGGDQ